jgi:hypothetical protein
LAESATPDAAIVVNPASSPQSKSVEDFCDGVDMANGMRWARGVAAGLLLALPLGALGADGIVPGVGGVYGGVGATYTQFDDLGHEARWGGRAYGGLGLLRVPAVFRLGVEGGFTRTGAFETDAAETGRLDNWDVGVQATLTTLPALNLHARAGYEWGDTSGVHFAAGASFYVVPLVRLRAEYQLRNEFNAAMLGVEIRIP